MKYAKWSYEKQIAMKMKSDSNYFWKFVQSKTKSKEKIISLIDNKDQSAPKIKKKQSL